MPSPEPLGNIYEGLGNSNSSVEEYIYRPLQSRHIRLLKVTQDSQGLRIIHTNFESAPPYTAVSYTWNDEVRNQNLLLEDGSHMKIIQTIKNGLPHLISSARTQYLWIDSVSINQEDDDEKAVQVPLMKEIYTLSQECLVWLGESTTEAEVALDAMPRINDRLKLYAPTRVWEMENIAVGSERTLYSPLWKGLVYIFSRPWFKRVWTFQEGVLPPKVDFLCGSRVVTFDEMAVLASPALGPSYCIAAFRPKCRPVSAKAFCRLSESDQNIKVYRI